jgi:hypothetical protein
MTVAIGFAGFHLDFDLDHEARTWVPVEPSSADLLDDDAFPLIGRSAGRRYELFGDGTFDTVDL